MNIWITKKSECQTLFGVSYSNCEQLEELIFSNILQKPNKMTPTIWPKCNLNCRQLEQRLRSHELNKRLICYSYPLIIGTYLWDKPQTLSRVVHASFVDGKSAKKMFWLTLSSYDILSLSLSLSENMLSIYFSICVCACVLGYSLLF
jgi:hypothetical protein